MIVVYDTDEECRGLLKHVLKPYDNRSDRQFYIVKIVYDFSTTRAARAIKIACDNRKPKSYRVNRPLDINKSTTDAKNNTFFFLSSIQFLVSFVSYSLSYVHYHKKKQREIKN